VREEDEPTQSQGEGNPHSGIVRVNWFEPDLAEILSLCEEAPRKRKLPEAKGSGSQLSLVAGARNRLDLQLQELLATIVLT
jgi:hypothetical protein